MLDGHLIIRPANGKESAVYYGNYGWDRRVQEATSLSFEGRVGYTLGRDLFYGMDKLKEADLSNLFCDGNNDLPQQREINLQECTSLEKIITNDTFKGYIGPEMHDYRGTPLISYFPDGYWMPEGASIPLLQSQIPDARANTYTLVSREPAEDTWYAAESIKWKYSDGRLTIKRLDPAMTNTVNSSVKDYQRGEAESPWLPFKDMIRSVSVEDKITATEGWIERRILADRSLTNLKAVDLHKVGVETSAYADSISCDANDSIATISLGSSFSTIRDNGNRWLELRRGYWQSRNNGDFFEHDGMPNKAADTYTFAGTDPKPNCWIHSNTAVWGLFDGQLTVKPAEGLDEGSFGHGYSFSSSWGKLAPQITSAKIEKKVHIDPQGLFSFDTRNVVDLGWFLPEWSTSFVTRTVGPNFSFKGYSSDINQVLMPQDSQWKSSTDVKTYNWDAIPSCVAATYFRVQKAPESSGFWDVDTSNPHFSSISWLSASGISTGYPDGTFHPMANVVRQDMAAFLKRIHDLGA